VCEFDHLGQTVSVGLLDGGQRLIVGTGGQAGKTGQPNLIYDLTGIAPATTAAATGEGEEEEEEGEEVVVGMALSMSSQQLVGGIATDYQVKKRSFQAIYALK
jgi:hypothetical protein